MLLVFILLNTNLESSINIIGIRELKQTKHRVIFDRIEAGTYIIASALTNGNLKIKNVIPRVIGTEIKLLKKTNATSVVSVFKSKEHAFKAFLPKDGFLKPFKSNYRKYYRRQLLPDFYHTTGAAYTFWFDTLKKFGHYYGPRMKPIISTKDEMNIDVDSLFDLFVAEMTQKHWKKYSKK